MLWRKYFAKINKAILNMSKKRGKKTFFLPRVDTTSLAFVKLLYLTLIVNIINLAYVLVVQRNLQPEVPLFYGLPEGQDQLTNSLGLSMPALVSFSISFVNFFIALYTKKKFFQQALLLTSFLISFFSLVTVVKITLLIGSF